MSDQPAKPTDVAAGMVIGCVLGIAIVVGVIWTFFAILGGGAK